MDPERMLKRSRQGAVRAAIQASRSSAAYRLLLQEHGVNPAAVGAKTDLATLPILTKSNTFGRFTLNDLTRPIASNELADVLTSSGRGGPDFGFRLTGRKRHEASWFDIDLGLQDVFKVDDYPTLLVNCLPMGVTFRSQAVTVANVSVREDMACAILREVGPRFAQTILCTDPLFIRRLLDEARVAGVDWKALNTSVIMGEEVLVEAQRDYIAWHMGFDIDRDPHRLIGSSFGVGELGLNLLFESRETIQIRRAMRRDPSLESLVTGRSVGGSMPSVFCYNPMRCHIEILHSDSDGYGELCFTVNDPDAVISLPRYTTGDYGRLVGRADVCAAAMRAGTEPPWLPVALVCGRLNDRPPELPSVEELKNLLYSDHAVADQISGAFRLARHGGRGVLTVQAASDDAAADATLANRITVLVNRGRGTTLHIKVMAPHAFPWRPMLDFERKFAYVTG